MNAATATALANERRVCYIHPVDPLPRYLLPGILTQGCIRRLQAMTNHSSHMALARRSDVGNGLDLGLEWEGAGKKCGEKSKKKGGAA